MLARLMRSLDGRGLSSAAKRSAWRLRAIVVDRRVSQRFWLKSARARRFFRSQRPRYFGIVPGTTAKARPPIITLFLDSSGSKSARAGRGSAIAAAGAIPLFTRSVAAGSTNQAAFVKVQDRVKLR